MNLKFWACGAPCLLLWLAVSLSVEMMNVYDSSNQELCPTSFTESPREALGAEGEPSSTMIPSFFFFLGGGGGERGA